MTNNHSKGRAIALLPIAVFLLFFIGSGLITGDFYSMPAIVGFLIALIIAFLQNKNLSFVQKLRLASTGVGDENILTMCLIFLAAGAFSGAVRAAGGVESTVNLGLSILPGNMAGASPPSPPGLTLARSHAGSRADIVHSRSCKVRSQNGALKLRILLDKNSVEVFVNDGEQTMTAWIYTPQSADGITFAADGKATVTVEQFELDL